MKRDAQKDIMNLTESAIKVIARDGFDRATTRNIAGECGMSDAYIYQYFSVKTELFSYTFAKEDAKLASEVANAIDASHTENMNLRERCHLIFTNLWRELMVYPDCCSFYIQYYYSPYYNKYSAVDHRENWSDIIERIQKYFKPDVDVATILRLSLNNLLDMAIKTINIGLQSDTTIAEFNFKTLFAIIELYLLDDKIPA